MARDKNNSPEDGMQSEYPDDRQQMDNMIAIVQASGNEQLSQEEKALLWKQIAGDIVVRPKIVSWPLVWKVAAAILVLLGAGLWTLQQQQGDEHALLAFAAEQHFDTGKSASTSVILGNNRQLLVKNNHAVITYQSSGTTLKVDSQEVHQQLVKDKPVFNTLLVPYGNIASLQLEDGTQVWLNAGSRLVYPAAFGKNKREVFLEGEAFFEVKQEAGRPFSVYAADLKVAVLGTAFNVSAYKDDATQQVVLASGSVQLQTYHNGRAGRTATQLRPGNRGMYTAGAENITVNDVNINEYLSWKEGLIIATHTPLKEILKKLARYYNQPIDVDTQSGNETFSGNLNLEKTVDDVLDIVAATTSLQYEKHGGKVIFKTR